MHRMVHEEGEVGTSKACAARCVPMILSALSNDSLEDVSAQSSDSSTPYAVQISPLNKRQVMSKLLSRAKGRAQVRTLIACLEIREMSLTTRCSAAGYKAVVLTVDAPMYGRRLQDVRNGFHIPRGTPLPNLAAPDVALSEISVSMSHVTFIPLSPWFHYFFLCLNACSCWVPFAQESTYRFRCNLGRGDCLASKPNGPGAMGERRLVY